MAVDKLSMKPHLSARKQITLPYTAECDGFVAIQARAASTNRLYASYSFGAWLDGYQISGGYVIGLFPVCKGQIISAPTTSANVLDYTYYWHSLNNP